MLWIVNDQKKAPAIIYNQFLCRNVIIFSSAHVSACNSVKWCIPFISTEVNMTGDRGADEAPAALWQLVIVHAGHWCASCWWSVYMCKSAKVMTNENTAAVTCTLILSKVFWFFRMSSPAVCCMSFKSDQNISIPLLMVQMYSAPPLPASPSTLKNDVTFSKRKLWVPVPSQHATAGTESQDAY